MTTGDILAMVFALIVCIPLFFMMFSIIADSLFVSNFCREQGFTGVENSGFINYCISKGAYEPNIPIDCDKDSVTGQKFCELKPEWINNCPGCWKTKCDKNGCKTIKAVA